VPSGLTRAILAGAFLTGVAFWVGSVVVFVDEMVGFGLEESLVGALVAVVVFETAVDVDLSVEDTGIVFFGPSRSSYWLGCICCRCDWFLY